MRKNCIKLNNYSDFKITLAALIHLGFSVASESTERKIHFGTEADSGLIAKIRYELEETNRPATNGKDLAIRIARN